MGLPPTSFDPLHVSLILGSFKYEGARYDLFDLSLPPSASTPPHPEESTFHVQPEISHTFQPDQKSPPKVISLVFAGLVLSPWALLLGLVSGRLVVLVTDSHTVCSYSPSFATSQSRFNPTQKHYHSSLVWRASKDCCSGIGWICISVKCSCTVPHSVSLLLLQVKGRLLRSIDCYVASSNEDVRRLCG